MTATTYIVEFYGVITEDAAAALRTLPGVHVRGSRGQVVSLPPEGGELPPLTSHLVYMDAPSAEAAALAVREVVKAHGDFRGFEAVPMPDSESPT